MAKRKYKSKGRTKRKNTSSKSKIIRSILLFILLVLIVGFISFRAWKSKTEEQAYTGSQIAMTEMGAIEYKSIGSGPVIILSHMGATGSDNIALFREIAEAGYRIICPSRPGYLQTPLTENANIEYQADLYAALLNQLNITEKVFIMGISAGGPSAIEFATKYSDRCKGLILHSAITKIFPPLSEMKDYSQLINIMLSPSWQDVFSWMNAKASKIIPTKMIQEQLERATTYDHEKIKKMAVQIAKVEKNKELFFLFNDCSSPLSIRTDGLQNDIKYAENFKAGKINVPVLITHSRVDKVVDFQHAKSLKKNIKIAELYEYDGYGHAIWFGEVWKSINNKSLAFLRKYKNDLKQSVDPDLSRLISETWVNKMNGAMLKIMSNGNFSLDFPGVDEKEIVNGRIRFEEKSLIFLYNDKSNYCKNIEGKYTFEIKKNELLLYVIKDKCESRKEHFSQGWFKL